MSHLPEWLLTGDTRSLVGALFTMIYHMLFQKNEFPSEHASATMIHNRHIHIWI